jgi:2-aminoethylphosphonate transport system permease protein
MSGYAVPWPERARWSTAPLWVVPPLLVLGVLFFYPLALIIRQSLTSGAHAVSFGKYASVFQTALFQHALLHTIIIALASSAGCVLLGFVLAVIIAFIRFPGAWIVARVIEMFIALPTFLIALAFTFIYGSAGLINQSIMAVWHLPLPPIDFLYSAWGVILAEITVYTPFALRPLLAAFSLIDAAQIEVASSLGAGTWRIIRRIIVPAAIPALLAGGSLCLLLTVNEFGIVLFIGAKGVITLPLLVYDMAVQEFDYPTACVIATVNIVLSLSLYSLYRLILSRFGGRGAGLV